MRAFLFACALGLGMTPAAATLAVADHADLYGGVSVGMAAAGIPKDDYKDFRCVSPKGKTVAGFADWKSCDSEADGLHMLHAEENEPGEEDTLVAGHPVDLTLGFGDDGKLQRIVIDTKVKGPMYLRKKAFLLGVQAKARYGDEGWNCQEQPLGPDEEALGPTSVKEHCVKTAGDHRITVDRALFRKTGAQQKDFTSRSHIVIDWAAAK
jgi:hypothetical protein